MDGELPQPAFRLNSAVLRVILLSFAALVLPMALVVLFFVRKADDRPAPEVAQLRTSAEAASEKVLPAPSLTDGRRVLAFPDKGEAAEKRRKIILGAAEKVGASVLELDGRILITVSPEKVSTFELEALLPPQANPRPAAGDVVLYEIHLVP